MHPVNVCPLNGRRDNGNDSACVGSRQCPYLLDLEARRGRTQKKKGVACVDEAALPVNVSAKAEGRFRTGQHLPGKKNDGILLPIASPLSPLSTTGLEDVTQIRLSLPIAARTKSQAAGKR